MRRATALQRVLPVPASLAVILAWSLPVAEILIAPLALWKPTRPYAWSIMFVGALGRLVVGHAPESKVGLVLLHLFTFDPDWLPPRGGVPDRVFYDGTCGLCHRLVRFVLAEDRTGRVAVFAPLQGETLTSELSPAELKLLPDSVVVLTNDSRMLSQSAAQLRLLDRLGGAWRVIARALLVVPRPLRDVGYRFIASNRYRIFGRTGEFCPLVPPELRERFLD